MPSTDPEISSSSDDLSNPSPAVDSARVLLWAKQHGPLAALALFILHDGGYIYSLLGVVC